MTKMSKKEQTEYLNPLIKSGRYSWAEIANLINEQLSKNVSPGYCENWAHKIHLKNHFYGDGHDQLIYQKPRPIGSHKKCNGYGMVKCADGNWRYTHRLIWQHAYGRIPDDKIVIFLDGDKSNLTIDNLMLVNRAEHAILTIRAKRSANGEITKSNLLRMRVNHLIKKRMEANA